MKKCFIFVLLFALALTSEVGATSSRYREAALKARRMTRGQEIVKVMRDKFKKRVFRKRENRKSSHTYFIIVKSKLNR